MNLKQQLEEKNFFLKKAYEVAYKHLPSSPLSVKIEPSELGKSIGYDEAKIIRIMSELVDDGYAQSSLGMKILLITSLGLNYLRELEDVPFSSPIVFDDAQNFDIHKMKNQNNLNMKQSEKLDLILRELYKYKNDGKNHSLGFICQSSNIPIDSDIEFYKLANRLKKDGFISASFTHNDCFADLTSYGIEYCEENSYTYKGHSIITNNYNLSIVNSSNVNVVNESTNVTISQNINEANQAIENIKKIIATDNTIEKEKVTEILECLNEIQESLKNNQKPKFSIKYLIDIAGGIASISSWLTVLGQFAGLIPLS